MTSKTVFAEESAPYNAPKGSLDDGGRREDDAGRVEKDGTGKEGLRGGEAGGAEAG